MIRIWAACVWAVLLPSPGRAAQAPAPDVAGASEPPARIERLLVRDELQTDGSSLRVMETRALLHDAVAVSQFGQISAPYILGYGEVVFEKIVIEKPDGRRVDVKDGVTEDLNPFGMSATPFPADFRVRRLTVPGLAAGDRVEYRMVVRHKPLFTDAIFGEYGLFRGPGAEEQSYELDTPADLRLSVWLRPGLGIAWQEAPAAAGRHVRRLTVRGAAPDPAEDARAEPDVIFTSFRTWNDLAKWWWALARDSFLPDEAVKAEAGRLTAGQDSPRARIAALHAFVTGQIRYLNVGLGSGRYQPQPAAQVLSARYADCKGKHALLAALASAAGLEVWPVLVHSSRKELHDEVPAPLQFDHMISVVKLGPEPSQWLWIDATADLSPMGYLPAPLRGKRALMVDAKGGHMVTIPEAMPFPTRLLVENNGTLEASGPLRSRVRWTARGDSEPWLRVGVRLMPREKWTELGKGLAKEWTRGVVSDVKAADPTDLKEPFWVEYAVVHEMSSKTFEKDWPLWVPLPEVPLPEPAEARSGKPAPETEFRLEDEVVFRARIALPPGMTARPPLSVTLERPFATYKSTYAVESGSLVVERVLRPRVRKIAADQAAAYDAFRTAVEADGKQKFQMEAFKSAAPEKLETADELNRAGKAALDERKDAELAVTLLRRAVEKDPQHKWAWNNLGRALRKVGKPEEALKAFGRQIEVNPYDEYAYGNRGSTLMSDLNRQAEAEKDFLKQIEVAPLKADAYSDLADLRLLQERFAEAADLFERASAADPSDDMVWLRLAWARVRARRTGVAEAAQRARALDHSPRRAIIGARAVALAGDGAAAAEIAKAALPALVASLHTPGVERLAHEREGSEMLYLAEAWRLVGAGAAAAGDSVTAERYLGASWQLGATPDAAVDLGRLREKQGRLPEALVIWQQASFLPVWGGNPAKRELERAVTDSARLKELLGKSSQQMATRQVQSLPGPVPDTVVQLAVRLVSDERGHIVEVTPREPKDAPTLAPLRDRVMAAVIPLTPPDQERFRLVRGGIVTCYPTSGCSLGLEIYGDEVQHVLER